PVGWAARVWYRRRLGGGGTPDVCHRGPGSSRWQTERIASDPAIPLDAAAHDVLRPLLHHAGCNQQSEADPASVSADLDRRLWPPDADAHGSPRRRVERIRQSRRTHGTVDATGRVVRCDWPRSINDPPLRAVRVGWPRPRRAGWIPPANAPGAGFPSTSSLCPRATRSV